VCYRVGALSHRALTGPSPKIDNSILLPFLSRLTEIPPEIQQILDDICPPSLDSQPYQGLSDFPHNHACFIFNSLFSIEEFEATRKKLKIKSSPGLDQIDNSILSSLSTPYHKILLSILNDLFNGGFFPKTWSRSLVYLIPKNSPGKFRPISLTSYPLKFLEKLILTRLERWMESKSYSLPPNMIFAKENPADNLGILTTEIFSGFALRQFTVCLFLDIKGAFDNVVPNLLIEDLINLGLPPKLCWFIYNLTSRRNIQFCINGEATDTRVSRKGLPQGSILSPLLFNIYSANYRKHISRECEILQFADDVAIFSRSSNLKESLRKIESSANKLSAHLSDPMAWRFPPPSQPW